MLGSDGVVYAFGDVETYGDQAEAVGQGASRSGAPVHSQSVDLAPTPSGDGYWILSSTGVVDAFGDARGRVAIDKFPTLDSDEQTTSIAATPSGDGLWIFTSKGRVFTYGTAQDFGDMAGTPLNGPVLDAVPTPSGRGYYMVGSDGGIFAFGDAVFHGSMGGKHLNAPVQSLVPDADGAGYWLVASDGGIFAFDAPFKGSMGGQPLNKPVTGMVRFGNGYLMVGADGGIFSFSDQPFFGSLGSHPPAHPIVSVATFDAPLDGPTTAPSAPDPAGQGASEATTTTTGLAAPAASTTTTSSSAPTTTTTLPPGADPSTGIPTHEYPCPDRTGLTAKVWVYARTVNPDTWAVDNPCTYDWVIVDLPSDGGPQHTGRALSVAPGTSFRRAVGDWTTETVGTESVSVTGQPQTECALGHELWEIGPDTAGQLKLEAVCPWNDDQGNQHYDGPLCFGRAPDYIGTDGDDRWGNVEDDINGDGYVTIYGGGGNDHWDSGSIDSGTFIDTWFCGGPGDDTADGWLEAIDGGDGNDVFTPTDCGTSWRYPTIVNVEVTNPASECPPDTP
jgi:hypothetical protein